MLKLCIADTVGPHWYVSVCMEVKLLCYSDCTFTRVLLRPIPQDRRAGVGIVRESIWKWTLLKEMCNGMGEHGVFIFFGRVT